MRSAWLGRMQASKQTLKAGTLHALRSSSTVSTKTLPAAAFQSVLHEMRTAAGNEQASGPCAALLSTLFPSFAGKSRNLTTTTPLRRRPPLPLLHPSAGRRAAFSTLPSSTARSTAASKKTSAAAAAAGSQSPMTTTISRCTPETARGRHVFEIAGYSLVKGFGAGNSIRSGTFSVGGYDWCVQYYPDGNSEDSDSESDAWDTDSDSEDSDEENDSDDDGYISVFLTLVSDNKAAEVRALCDLTLVNPATGLSPVMCYSCKRPRRFNGQGATWGKGKFMLRSELEASEYLRDDCLMIQCDISVITGMQVSPSDIMSDVQVPPSDQSRKT